MDKVYFGCSSRMGLNFIPQVREVCTVYGFDSAQKREDWRRDGSMTRKIISDKEARKFGFYVDENGDHIPYGMN
jgi:hypothetical protein